MIQKHNQTEFENLNILLTDGQRQAIREKENLLKEVIAYYPAKLVFITSFSSNIHHFDRVEIYLKHDFLDLELHFNSYIKKFRVWCRSYDNLKNITRSDIRDIEKKHKEPNQIGKLTTNKFKDWVAHYEKLYPLVEKQSNKNKTLIDQFLEKLEGFEVRWYNDKKSGEIFKNGIEYTFSIIDNYVNQNVKLSYKVKHSLDAFAKLSDNGFGKEEKTKKLIKF